MTTPHGHSARRPGFTLVEAVISMGVVGLMLAAALAAVGAARKAEFTAAGRSAAHVLAQDLLAEILPLPYESPTLPPGSAIGPSNWEAAAGNRSRFDDVDDYHNWSESPPAYRDGTPMPGYAGWSRSVLVQWVKTSDPDSLTGTASGLKRVRVTVKRGHVVMAELHALRCLTGPALPP